MNVLGMNVLDQIQNQMLGGTNLPWWAHNKLLGDMMRSPITPETVLQNLAQHALQNIQQRDEESKIVQLLKNMGFEFDESFWQLPPAARSEFLKSTLASAQAVQKEKAMLPVRIAAAEAEADIKARKDLQSKLLASQLLKASISDEVKQFAEKSGLPLELVVSLIEKQPHMALQLSETSPISDADAEALSQYLGISADAVKNLFKDPSTAKEILKQVADQGGLTKLTDQVQQLAQQTGLPAELLANLIQKQPQVAANILGRQVLSDADAERIAQEFGLAPETIKRAFTQPQVAAKYFERKMAPKQAEIPDAVAEKVAATLNIPFEAAKQLLQNSDFAKEALKEEMRLNRVEASNEAMARRQITSNEFKRIQDELKKANETTDRLQANKTLSFSETVNRFYKELPALSVGTEDPNVVLSAMKYKGRPLPQILQQITQKIQSAEDGKVKLTDEERALIGAYGFIKNLTKSTGASSIDQAIKSLDVYSKELGVEVIDIIKRIGDLYQSVIGSVMPPQFASILAQMPTQQGTYAAALKDLVLLTNYDKFNTLADNQRGPISDRETMILIGLTEGSANRTASKVAQMTYGLYLLEKAIERNEQKKAELMSKIENIKQKAGVK